MTICNFFFCMGEVIADWNWKGSAPIKWTCTKGFKYAASYCSGENFMFPAL